jgi:hypothetical protein
MQDKLNQAKVLIDKLDDVTVDNRYGCDALSAISMQNINMKKRLNEEEIKHQQKKYEISYISKINDKGEMLFPLNNDAIELLPEYKIDKLMFEKVGKYPSILESKSPISMEYELNLMP